MNQAKKPLRPNMIVLLLILGLIAFILYFYFFINPAQVIDILSRTNLAYYTGAFVAYFLYAFFSALVWHDLLNSLSVKISTLKALLFTWVGLFFEALVPQLGWSGEVSKTYLFAKDSSEDAGKIGASVVGQKIFTIAITDVALGLGLGLVLISYPLSFAATFLIAIVLTLSILALVVVYYVSLRPTATTRLLNWAIRAGLFFRRSWNPQNFLAKAEELLGSFHVDMCKLNANPKALIKPIIYTVVSFVFEISVIFLAFIALGYNVPVDKVLIVFTLTGTLQTIGLTVFGFTEIVMPTLFTALGLPIDLSFSVTLLTRFVSLWFRLIVSYAALQWAGIKIIRKKQNGNFP
jgi:uncharacterized protein (TIRG00374 family)